MTIRDRVGVADIQSEHIWLILELLYETKIKKSEARDLTTSLSIFSAVSSASSVGEWYFFMQLKSGKHFFNFNNIKLLNLFRNPKHQ